MNLKMWRKNEGLTQAELAEAVGCEAATISRIETGRITPSARLCGRIFRRTNGAVTAQDHQAAWEAANAAANDELQAARAALA